MKFVVFGEDWDSHPSSTQHLFEEISNSHSVVWFNSVGMRAPKFNLTDLKRLCIKGFKILSGHQSDNKSNISPDTICNPFLLPWHNNKFNKNFNQRQIMKLIKQYWDEPIVYWISVPSAFDMIKVRNQDTLIYYCGDDFSGLAGVDYEMVKASENKLIFRSDFIFVASHKLLEKMPAHKTQVLEHGVDFDLFTKKTDKHPLMPLATQVIGFYGSISSWIDYDLLVKLTRERPQYHLILIGKSHVDISRLVAKDNVTHVPEVAHEELACFSQYWNVSILPFLDNKQIKSCNPLKLKEYLAVGAPIVSTRFPAVERYKETVLIADNHNAFLQRVDYAMSLVMTPAIHWSQASQQCVKIHTWQHKAAYVLAQLNA